MTSVLAITLKLIQGVKEIATNVDILYIKLTGEESTDTLERLANEAFPGREMVYLTNDEELGRILWVPDKVKLLPPPEIKTIDDAIARLKILGHG